VGVWWEYWELDDEREEEEEEAGASGGLPVLQGNLSQRLSTHACIFARMHTHILSFTHTHTQTHTHAHTEAHAHTHASTRTHTRTHARTHTHTHLQRAVQDPQAVRRAAPEEHQDAGHCVGPLRARVHQVLRRQHQLWVAESHRVQQLHHLRQAGGASGVARDPSGIPSPSLLSSSCRTVLGGVGCCVHMPTSSGWLKPHRVQQLHHLGMGYETV